MRICIFCGSSTGIDPAYRQAGQALAAAMVERGIELVYGGGRVGLMGVVADAVLAAGGHVIGVIPELLHKKEVGHEGVSELIVVKSMHERKTKMADLSDGFVTLPGGMGTLEEIFEQWTWAQLGIHDKFCGFLDVRGYYAHLRGQVAHMVQEGFVREDHGRMAFFAQEPTELLDAFDRYQSTHEELPPKW